jgi:hypothetical protein
MLKETKDKFDGDEVYNPFMLKNPVFKSGYESEIEKMLLNFQKNPLNTLDINYFKGASPKNLANLNYVSKKLSVFSEINTEVYFLFASKNTQTNTIQTQPVENIYYLLTFSFQTNSLKSSKKLEFYQEISPNEKFNLNFKIEEMIIHQKNQNQLCFMGKDYLAFISNLKEATNENRETTSSQQKSEILKIKVLHTSNLEKPKDTLKGGLRSRTQSTASKNNTTQNIKDPYKKLKFSNYDNYFGVLTESNTFRFYNLDSRVSKSVIENISKDNEVVDFEFGPNLDFGWLNFSIFFLDINGGIHYACPIFPDEFSMKASYYKNMQTFTKNMSVVNVNSSSEDTKENEHVLNQNILYHFCKKFIAEGVQDDFIVKSDDYLKNFNNKPNLNSFTIIDRRKQTDLLLMYSHNSENVKYKNIFIMNMYPLVILRVSDKNSIDVIVSLDEISPIRKNKESGKQKDGFLLETIYMKNFSRNADQLSTLDFKFNILPYSNISGNKNYSLYVNFLNDIYELEISYLKNLHKFFEHFEEKKTDIQLDFNSNINKILVFNYDEIFRQQVKSNVFYGYLGIEKIFDTFCLVSFINNKFFVKEFDLVSDEKMTSSNVEENNLFDFRKLGGNIQKLCNNSETVSLFPDVNFQNIDTLATKA